MAWSHPDITLEDLLKLIKGFVDILLLASGYQTSGHLAHWDSRNIQKVFQWGLFFENVFKRLSCLDDYRESAKELDAALSEMTSNPCFPQGIAHLSSATLSRAKDFVLEYMIHALPLREAHLRAFMMAIIEMDLDELRRTENNGLHVYLNKLMLQNTSSNEVFDRSGLIEDSTISSPDIAPNQKTDSYGDFTTSAIQKLVKRQLTVSCISSVGTALDSLSKTIGQSNWTESDNSSFTEQQKHTIAPLRIDEQSVEYVTWNHWRKRNLSYFLDKRTIQLVSGASMIFSAPKIQWIQVFERLTISAKNNDDDLLGIMELLLLGCIASRWSSLIEHFMTVTYDTLTTSKQYHEICNLLCRRFQNLHSKEKIINSKEKDILEQLAVLVSGQPQQLWKLSPTLAAVAIPSWSQLFKFYLSDLDSQFKGDSSTISFCSCIQDRKVHKDCELAERIWCLYIFHVRGSHILRDASIA